MKTLTATDSNILGQFTNSAEGFPFTLNLFPAKDCGLLVQFRPRRVWQRGSQANRKRPFPTTGLQLSTREQSEAEQDVLGYLCGKWESLTLPKTSERGVSRADKGLK